MVKLDKVVQTLEFDHARMGIRTGKYHGQTSLTMPPGYTATLYSLHIVRFEVQTNSCSLATLGVAGAGTILRETHRCFHVDTFVFRSYAMQSENNGMPAISIRTAAFRRTDYESYRN